MTRPELTFACELEPKALQTLFGRVDVIDRMKALDGRISLGILDLSPERAAVVNKLNEAGIEVTAWLLLSKEQGYWFNLDNVSHAVQRYIDFKTWTDRYGLKWAGIGLDIEPDIRLVQRLAKDPVGGSWSMLARLFNEQRSRNAREAYRELVRKIHQDNYLVESYQFPFIVDERIAGASFLQRITGIVDLEVDREILMLYTSFMRGYGPGLLWNYGKEAQSIGIGSTGGGVEVEGIIERPPLDWEELKRDLLLSAALTRRIFIFSLEGCLRRGFLDHLIGMDWDENAILPLRVSYRVERYRRLLQFFLWLTARPWWIWLALAGIVMFIQIQRRKLKR